MMFEFSVKTKIGVASISTNHLLEMSSTHLNLKNILKGLTIQSQYIKMTEYRKILLIRPPPSPPFISPPEYTLPKYETQLTTRI